MDLRATIGAIMASALSVSVAHAGFLELGGGWVAEWDVDLDPLLILEVNGVTQDGVFLDKTAFYKPGFFESGPPVTINFRQVDPNAVPYIVIQDEALHNNTMFEWTQFDMELAGDPDVEFDPVRTANSGGPGPIGWNVNPFQDAEFIDGNRTLRVSNGSIAPGQVWQAGAGPGSLWIFADPERNGPFTEFTLTETPVLPGTPAPGALALLALGGIVGLSSRRRS